MPRIICTPEIVKNVLAAQHQISIMLSPLQVFEEKLNIQDLCYSNRNLKEHSLLSQIDAQFSSGMEQYNGLFFVDVDNTILNCVTYGPVFKLLQSACQTGPLPSFDRFYNAAPLLIWKDILQSLRRKKFCVVLCTSRIPIIDVARDPAIQKMVYEDLAGLFDCELFTGALDHKGPLIHFIRSHIFRRQRISYFDQNVYLLDDQDSNLQSATALNISTIRSSVAPKHPLAPFIIQLLSVQSPAPTLPLPFSPASSPTARIPIVRL